MPAAPFPGQTTNRNEIMSRVPDGGGGAYQTSQKNTNLPRIELNETELPATLWRVPLHRRGRYRILLHTRHPQKSRKLGRKNM